MPLFRIDIEKVYGGEYWTNTYLATANSLQEASTAANDILFETEVAIHYQHVLFNKVRTSTVEVDDFQYISIPKSVQGGITISSSPNPLFDAIRVDFTVLGLGRPSRKFYRGMLCKGDWNDHGVLTGTRISEVTAALNSALTAMNTADVSLCDPQGQLLTDTIVINKYTCRQLRRGTRRRTEPVLP